MSDPRLEDILPVIEGDSRLKQIYEVSPVALEKLLEAALFGAFSDYWRAYEQLKQQAMSFVGWQAEGSQLRTSTHYESVVTFIDWLLTYIGFPQIHELSPEDEQDFVDDEDWLVA